MDEPNVLNIPAYQRKRSLAAKSRKKPSYLRPQSKPKTRKRIKKQTVPEIPIQNVLPSQEIFPDPFLNDLPQKNKDLREMKTCGICEGYFDNIEVAIVKVTSPIRINDKIIFEKQDGLFEQEVKSMQINRKDITLATTGSEIGLKVYQQPTVGAPVYKIVE